MAVLRFPEENLPSRLLNRKLREALATAGHRL